jgi:hypothetical protein
MESAALIALGYMPVNRALFTPCFIRLSRTALPDIQPIKPPLFPLA